MGNFREQNLAILIGAGLTTLGIWLAYRESWPIAVFVILWIVSLAVPALPSSFALWLRRARGMGMPQSEEAQRVSANSLWIAAAQQLAMGLDLVIVTVALGSLAAAEFGLVTRLMYIAVVPVIGAAPAVTRFAAEARRNRGPASQRTSRRLALGIMCAVLIVCLLFIVFVSWVCEVLSSGAIQPDTSLVLAAGLWIFVDGARRVMIALSATSRGLRQWAFGLVAVAVPNVVLSFALVRTWGEAGPLFASCFSQGLVLAVVGVRLRRTLREALSA